MLTDTFRSPTGVVWSMSPFILRLESVTCVCVVNKGITEFLAYKPLELTRKGTSALNFSLDLFLKYLCIGHHDGVMPTL